MDMPTTLRQEYTLRTRQSLLDHACQFFMERGCDAASLDELVERAMTKGG
jgi:AcrR family transcriptional regulator